MLGRIQHLGKRAFWHLDRWGNFAFGEKLNPMYHLGTLSFYFFYILFVSGIYLYIYFSPDIALAYDRLEYLTHEQWYLGGVMRSLHRYISDALIVTISLHMLRWLVMGKYRRFRWFFWTTGIVMLWIVFPTGVTGYWLVWDELAQYIAVRTSEWLDWLPLFAEPIARNFLSNETVSNTFFRLLLVVHFVLPVFLLIAMFTHVYRLKAAKINPPKSLAIGTLLAFIALSLIKPALSHEPANLSMVPASLHLDWFYLFLYPLMDMWSIGAVWGLLFGTTLLLLLIPWLSPHHEELAASVEPDECSGCGYCEADCPYEAISIQPRVTPHERYTAQAVVDSKRCSSCGICVGACPSSSPFRHTQKLISGINLPVFEIDHLRNLTKEAVAKLHGNPTIIVYGCDHAADIHLFQSEDTAAISLPCIGMLPPSMVDFALQQGIEGVFITGCCNGDCYNRLGNELLLQRLREKRNPSLRKGVPRERFAYCWATPADSDHLAREIDAFRNLLRQKPVPDGSILTTGLAGDEKAGG